MFLTTHYSQIFSLIFVFKTSEDMSTHKKIETAGNRLVDRVTNELK